MQSLIRNRWLLAWCGLLEAAISAVYLVLWDAPSPLTFHAWKGTVALLGILALVAGASTVAAGVRKSTSDVSWPLVLNGLALAALGVLYYGFVRTPISFLTIALLIVLMALSAAILDFGTARALRRQSRRSGGPWFWVFAAVASIAFAGAFCALGFHWIAIEPGSRRDLLWLGSYFAFSAISLLMLALYAAATNRSDLVPQIGQTAGGSPNSMFPHTGHR
jgi:uncharacterized membrane protein HdeD (DUF308 family)